MEDNSTVDESVLIYRDVRIKSSTVRDRSELGDFARIYNSDLRGRNRIGRSSLIYHSKLEAMTYTGSNTVIMHSDIGRYSSISWNVTIGPANHDYSRLTTHDFLYNDIYKITPDYKSVTYDRFQKRTTVGSDVWVGTGVVIVSGITIGDGAVIGANSTVTKDVPPYAIVAGSPAKVIKYRFNSDIIKELVSLKWWDYSYDEICKISDLIREKVSMSVVSEIKERLKI